MMTFIGIGVVCLAEAGAWITLPHFLEQPDYRVVRESGSIELRAHAPMIVSEVRDAGPRGEAVREGFGALARQIFARDRPGESIAMTAPVTQQASGEGERWAVRFVMPSRFSLDSLPQPANAAVDLVEIPVTTRAAIRFGGVATDEMLAEKEQALRTWLDSEGLVAAAPPILADYNDPSTPGIFRRNEILIDVVSVAAGVTRRPAGRGTG